MGLTRADLIGEMSDQERADRQAWIDRTSSNDKWATKIFKKVGVLITGHQANRPYMRACIESHAKLGFWITLAYDNYVNPVDETVDHNRFMPGKETLDLVNTFVTGTYQVWGGVLYPYFWLLKLGAGVMKDFEYIYCTNSDFVLEKPEGFEELFNMMGDADVMTSGHDEPGRYANTAGFIIKGSALASVVKHMQDHFIPFEVYEKYTNDIGNAEGRFGRAIHDLGLKQKIVDPPADDMLCVPGTGTWYKTIGFRHIHSEHNSAYRRKGIPPHYKYLDQRFMGGEYNIIKEYWDTGNISLLENWWAKD